jgi:hypothetical protein
MLSITHLTKQYAKLKAVDHHDNALIFAPFSFDCSRNDGHCDQCGMHCCDDYPCSEEI